MSLLDQINKDIELLSDWHLIDKVEHYKTVLSEITTVGRWSYVQRVVVTDDVDYVEVMYELPNTEYQDVEPGMTARLVKPVDKVVTVYV